MEPHISAILAADMVGYSPAVEADEEGTITRQKVHRVNLIDPTIARHRRTLAGCMTACRLNAGKARMRTP
jgi:adenylate cyclase